MSDGEGWPLALTLDTKHVIKHRHKRQGNKRSDVQPCQDQMDDEKGKEIPTCLHLITCTVTKMQCIKQGLHKSFMY